MTYDLTSLAFKANPYPTYAAMRRNDPVYGQPWLHGRTQWLITGYKEAEQVLRDHQRFVKDFHRVLPPGRFEDVTPDTGLFRLINEHMLHKDPPDHTRLRHLVSQAFTPRLVAQLQPRIEAIAHELLDRVQGGAEVDLIQAYAFLLPIQVIAELLGVPVSDNRLFHHWSVALMKEVNTRAEFEALTGHVRDFTDYLRQLFAQRRQQPADDLLSALLRVEETGDVLSEAELFSTVVLLLIAGHETTVNLIGNGVLALLQHPAQLALLQRDFSLIEGAVEEMIRYDGPVEVATPRYVFEEVAINGRGLHRGDMVSVVLAAANRDATYFAAPDTFDITRQGNRHLGFGLGIHYCLGAPLARLEAQISIPILLQRFPTLRLAVAAEQLVWRDNRIVRGLTAMPVTW